MNFDWQKVEQLAFEYVVDCVTQIHQKHPNEKIYGAMFHCFYGDGENIYFPPVSVGTEELLAKVVDNYKQNPSHADETHEQLSKILRWSGADLADYMFDKSELFDKCGQLAEQVAQYAKETSGYDFDDDDTEENFEKWDEIYQTFENCFPKACKRATQYLLTTNMVEPDFIAVAIDENLELVRLSLTKEQLAKHFAKLLSF